MLYFQLSEAEYNSLRRVEEQLGLVSSLIIGGYPGPSLEVVTTAQLLAFVETQEEAIGAVMESVQRRGVVRDLEPDSAITGSKSQ